MHLNRVHVAGERPLRHIKPSTEERRQRGRQRVPIRDYVVLGPRPIAERRRTILLRFLDHRVDRGQHHLVPRRVLRVEQMLRLPGDHFPDGPFTAPDGCVVERLVRFVAFRQHERDHALGQQIAEAMDEAVRR